RKSESLCRGRFSGSREEVRKILHCSRMPVRFDHVTNKSPAAPRSVGLNSINSGNSLEMRPDAIFSFTVMLRRLNLKYHPTQQSIKPTR
ncbi:MAG: hypothetical protein PVI27_12320, partial [Desulfobacteraceae bacterium]